MTRYIRLDENNIVRDERTGTSIIEGEIESNTGEAGQIMQEDGTFITPEPALVEPAPTLQEQVEQLKQDNLILMDALATTFEEILSLGAKIDTLGGTP